MINIKKIDFKILEQQISTLYEATLTGGIANTFAAWLIFSMVPESKIEDYALYLSISITIISFLRYIIVSVGGRRSKKTFNLVLYTYIILTFSLGAAWSGFIYAQSLQNDTIISNMIYLINFGLIAGGLATLSVWAPAYLAYILPQTVTIFLVLAHQTSSVSIYYAFAFIVFIAVMISESLRFHRAFVHSLELKNGLIESRENLEQKVKSRTVELEEINKKLLCEIQEKNKARSDLEYIAYHDELTGLPKKNLLIDRVNYSIESAKRNKTTLALLFLDLDRFKTINDTLGHVIGDQLIKSVATRLRATLRHEDTISRNGGDEFVVVIKDVKEINEIKKVAQKIIDAVTSIFDIMSHTIHIGVSIGISVYPTDGDTALKLIKNADTSMFDAKKLGGNQYQFYDSSMSERLTERLQIETELHTALENNEFYLVYQPQVNTNTNEIIGYEALMRWDGAALGAVSPCQFIPLLEETGLIYDVGKWIIETVIKFIKTGATHDASVSINLSPLQCHDLELIEHINNLIEKYEIDSSYLEFEITETVLINDFKIVESFLNQLHLIGCTVTLDDFGTGYTSMNYLTQLPIDVIKIDQSFIRGIDKSPKLENIVNAIVTMSQSLGIKNIFEGVETLDELKVVTSIGGEIVQGYYYSKPLPEKEIKNIYTADQLLDREDVNPAPSSV